MLPTKMKKGLSLVLIVRPSANARALQKSAQLFDLSYGPFSEDSFALSKYATNIPIDHQINKA